MTVPPIVTDALKALASAGAIWVALEIRKAVRAHNWRDERAARRLGLIAFAFFAVFLLGGIWS